VPVLPDGDPGTDHERTGAWGTADEGTGVVTVGSTSAPSPTHSYRAGPPTWQTAPVGQHPNGMGDDRDASRDVPGDPTCDAPGAPSSDPGRGFDAATYGRSFADVYDDWYPDDDATAAAVGHIVALAGPGATVLELGVGTGRLALPLAAAGLVVVGLDSSPEMLARLRAKDPGRTVQVVDGDVADPARWPVGPVDVVVAACNLICNLADAAAQERCVHTAALRLRPGGRLVVEAFVPAPLQRGRHLEVSEVRGDAVIMIATDADPGTGVVTAQHMEFRDGEPVRLRPWRIRVTRPEEVDAWAAAAGLVLESRHADWSGTPFDPQGSSQVSVYVRPAP